MSRIVLILFSVLLLSAPYHGETLFSPIISMPEEDEVFFTYLIDNNQNIINSWESDYCVAHTPYLVDDTVLVRPGRVFPPFFDAGGIGGIIQKYDWVGNLV